VAKLEQVQRLMADLAGVAAPGRAAEQTPPHAVAATSGHVARTGQSGRPATAKRPRREHSTETKARAVARAAEVGVTKASSATGCGRTPRSTPWLNRSRAHRHAWARTVMRGRPGRGRLRGRRCEHRRPLWSLRPAMGRPHAR
jgi:transposase-like protein